MKNVVIGVLAASTALLAFTSYQSNQKVVALDVLVADKNSTISRLETERNALVEKANALQSQVDGYAKIEAERKAQEEALNAATVSEADLKEFGESCRLWIAREFGDDDYPTVTASLTQLTDSWMKDGFLVFEIATPSRTGSTSSVFLCVVDKEKGSMFKPSAFETASWRKPR